MQNLCTGSDNARVCARSSACTYGVSLRLSGAARQPPAALRDRLTKREGVWEVIMEEACSLSFPLPSEPFCGGLLLCCLQPQWPRMHFSAYCGVHRVTLKRQNKNQKPCICTYFPGTYFQLFKFVIKEDKIKYVGLHAHIAK